MTNQPSQTRLKWIAAAAFATAALLSVLFFEFRLGGALDVPSKFAAYATYVAGSALLAAGVTHWLVPERRFRWLMAVLIPVAIALVCALLAALSMMPFAGVDTELTGQTIFWKRTPQEIGLVVFYFFLVTWPIVLIAGAIASLVVCIVARSSHAVGSISTVE